ncbi:MAG: HlyC/CorC family transporter [Kiritimatiellaeota bacterium]|nr:HlyC/CorC family transporter [Kiritimatiellota bacterium]
MRRIEAKDKKLARKIEEWLDDKNAYELVFRSLVFLFVCLLAGISLFLIRSRFQDISGTQSMLYSVLATFAFVMLTETITGAFIARFDLPILSFTMPLLKLLRFSVFFPALVFTEFFRGKMEQWNAQEDDEEKATTEDEILSLVDQDDNPDADEESSLEEDEKRMIRGVFELDDTAVREIMTPRVDVNAISMNEPIEEAVKLFIETGHSRIPVYDDNVDNIKGILYAKDFLNSEKIKGKSLMELARRPIFIPETKEVGDLLQEIQKTRNHFAVVIDEYGGTAGIVTLEDIIEEIVGEIRDEYDADEDDAPMHVEMPDGSVVFDARTLIDDVNEVLDSDIPDGEDVDTIGGFVCGELGHIPMKDETLDLKDHNLKMTVLQADNKKIIKVKIAKTR